MFVKVNIGCGNDYRDGFINIDKNDNVKCDMVVDLEEGKIPLEDGSVDYIMANHVLEHINNLIPLMNELHRILKPKGVLHVEVPMAGTPAHWKDPTHVRGFIPQTFKYFAEWNTCASYGVTSWGKVKEVTYHEDEATGENTYLVCELLK